MITPFDYDNISRKTSKVLILFGAGCNCSTLLYVYGYFRQPAGLGTSRIILCYPDITYRLALKGKMEDLKCLFTDVVSASLRNDYLLLEHFENFHYVRGREVGMLLYMYNCMKCCMLGVLWAALTYIQCVSVHGPLVFMHFTFC